MPRQIVTSEFALQQAQLAYPAGTSTSNSSESAPDRYKDRLVKLIPGEVVTVYLLLSGIITATDPEKVAHGPLLTAVFVVLLALTWPYLSRIAGVTNHTQLAISTVAFAVWVFSLGGPFVYLMELLGWHYHPIYGGILLPLYTFAVPIIDNTYTGPPR